VLEEGERRVMSVKFMTFRLDCGLTAVVGRGVIMYGEIF
jgi:hypothetical protein